MAKQSDDAMDMSAMAKKLGGAGVWGAAANPWTETVAAMTKANAAAFGLASQAWGLWLSAAMSAWSARGSAEAIETAEHAAHDTLEFLSYGVEPDGALEGDEAAKPVKAKRAKAKAEKAATASTSAMAAVTAATVALEPEDFRPPKKIAKPARPDDLKQISGVGPKLEKVLNGLGVWTFAQIAEWGPEEIAWVDDSLGFDGRIGRDGWIAQAAALARGGRDEYVKVFGKEPR